VTNDVNKTGVGKKAEDKISYLRRCVLKGFLIADPRQAFRLLERHVNGGSLLDNPPLNVEKRVRQSLGSRQGPQ
jgi:hypothetical protein